MIDKCGNKSAEKMESLIKIKNKTDFLKNNILNRFNIFIYLK